MACIMCHVEVISLLIFGLSSYTDKNLKPMHLKVIPKFSTSAVQKSFQVSELRLCLAVLRYSKYIYQIYRRKKLLVGNLLHYKHSENVNIHMVYVTPWFYEPSFVPNNYETLYIHKDVDRILSVGGRAKKVLSCIKSAKIFGPP